MTLWATVELWNELHPGSDFWSSFTLHEKVDRRGLIDYLMLEYSDCGTLDSNTSMCRKRVENFFIVHKWNIDKLVESMYFDYDPIHNTNYQTHERWDRDETIDTHKNVDNDWTEKGHTDETDTNYVSAFNDHESREGAIVDTEHHRDVIDIDYSKEGTDDTITDQNVVEDEGYERDFHEWGHRQTHTYQELIEQERNQAQFNIYKWIARHFHNEVLIPTW